MPALWASLRIAPPDGPPQQWKNPTQWFRSKRALAQRVAPLIESFELENLDSFSTLTRKIAVQAFLDALEPAALASLCIRKCGGTLSEQAAARLLQFTRLQRLELNAYIYADLSCLAQLTALCLEPPRRPEELTRLQQLAELELIQPFSVDAALPLLPASAFPRLTRLAFCASSFKVGRWDVEGAAGWCSWLVWLSWLFVSAFSAATATPSMLTESNVPGLLIEG